MFLLFKSVFNLKLAEGFSFDPLGDFDFFFNKLKKMTILCNILEILTLHFSGKVWYVFVLLPTFHNQQTLGVIASHSATSCISSLGQFMSSIEGEALEGIRGLNLYWVYDWNRFPSFPNNWTNPSLPFFHSQMEHQALNRTEGLESVTFLLGGVNWSHFPIASV